MYAIIPFTQKFYNTKPFIIICIQQFHVKSGRAKFIPGRMDVIIIDRIRAQGIMVPSAVKGRTPVG